MVKMNMKNMFCKHECVTYVNKIYDMALFRNCEKHVLNMKLGYGS